MIICWASLRSCKQQPMLKLVMWPWSRQICLISVESVINEGVFHPWRQLGHSIWITSVLTFSCQLTLFGRTKQTRKQHIVRLHRMWWIGFSQKKLDSLSLMLGSLERITTTGPSGRENCVTERATFERCTQSKTDVTPTWVVCEKKGHLSQVSRETESRGLTGSSPSQRASICLDTRLSLRGFNTTPFVHPTKCQHGSRFVTLMRRKCRSPALQRDTNRSTCSFLPDDHVHPELRAGGKQAAKFIPEVNNKLHERLVTFQETTFKKGPPTGCHLSNVREFVFSHHAKQKNQNKRENPIFVCKRGRSIFLTWCIYSLVILPSCKGKLSEKNHTPAAGDFAKYRILINNWHNRFQAKEAKLISFPFLNGMNWIQDKSFINTPGKRGNQS